MSHHLAFFMMRWKQAAPPCELHLLGVSAKDSELGQQLRRCFPGLLVDCGDVGSGAPRPQHARLILGEHLRSTWHL